MEHGSGWLDEWMPRERGAPPYSLSPIRNQELFPDLAKLAISRHGMERKRLIKGNIKCVTPPSFLPWPAPVNSSCFQRVKSTVLAVTCVSFPWCLLSQWARVTISSMPHRQKKCHQVAQCVDLLLICFYKSRACMVIVGRSQCKRIGAGAGAGAGAGQVDMIVQLPSAPSR